ncbi:hypothetical protein GCM10027592_19270 [Spirosoma flavus]
MTRLTTFCLANALLVIACTTTSVSAQSTAHRAAPAKQATRTSPSRPMTYKPVRPTQSTQSQPAATSQARPVQEQPAASQPAVSQTRNEPAATSTQQSASRSQSSGQRARNVSHRGSRASYLNLGIGLATYYGGGVPVGVSYEVGLKSNPNFSVGASVDYFHYNYGYYSSGYNFVYAGARGSFHLAEAFNTQSKSFDPYIGATLGFRYAGYSDSYGYDYYGSGYNSGVFVGIQLGSRFLFSKKVGAFAEVGYGVSALKLGLTAKF